jgi:hypothetical protein
MWCSKLRMLFGVPVRQDGKHYPKALWECFISRKLSGQTLAPEEKVSCSLDLHHIS